MRVSVSWLKELIDLKVSVEELTRLIPLRTIGLKEVTSDFVELDMKGYNRVDLLSMRGVAKEVAAITDSGVTFKDEPIPNYDIEKTSVKVDEPRLCSVYCIAKIEGLKVKASAPEWVQKLEDSGMRPVNNIADVTNLIMLEFGQPMHAFDAKGVKDETLIVRTAKPGERITTLDGKTRNLSHQDLLIADSQNALGIAGVMGGKDSEVSETTTAILLEAAIFDPVSIRITTQRHGLYSEASKRFQRGLTKTNLLQALSAAIKMYDHLGGKLTAISLTGNLEDKPKIIQLTQKKVNDLIGIDIPPEQVELSLEALGFKLASHMESGNVVWEVSVPYWRLDIDIEEDLVEEVVRMYGYEKIPPQGLRGKLPDKIDQTLPNFIYDLKAALADEGLTEVQTYSFFSTQTLNALGWLEQDNTKYLVKVANPISSETEYLRQNIWPNLIEVVGKNLRNGFPDIAIFEIGKAYISAENGLPAEQYRLSVAICDGTDNPATELPVILNTVAKLHLRGELKVESGIHLGGDSLGEHEKRLFHPTRFKHIEVAGKLTGGLAEVHPRILNEYGLDKRVAILEINLE